MTASVPEDTKRTCSMVGKASRMRSAASISCTAQAPKDSPEQAVRWTASMTLGWACPRMSGPQDMQ